MRVMHLSALVGEYELSTEQPEGCGEYFFGFPWYSWRRGGPLAMGLVRSCQSCSLPKYANANPDRPA
jgi:hypothetical protein